MSESAKLELEGKTYDLPIITGTQNERALDIRALRGQSGYITLDSGFGNTGSVQSSITYIDGRKVSSSIAVFRSKKSQRKVTLSKQATY